MGRLSNTQIILLRNKAEFLLSLYSRLTKENLRLTLLKDILKIKNILKNNTIFLDN